ncbi:TRAP transporter large permease subunit [Chloroflexota bacterium]
MRPVSRWTAAFGGIVMVVLMLIIVTDVIMRNLLSRVIMGSVDLVGLLLVIVFFAAYAISELEREHIHVDVLIRRFSSNVQNIITTNGYFLSIGIAVIMSWQFFSYLGPLMEGPHVTPLLHVIEWPFSLATGFFMLLFTLALIVNFLKYLHQLLNNNGNKTYLFLLPGLLIALALFAIALWPEILPSGISRNLWGGVIVSLLFVLIFLNVHIGISMTLIALIGFSYLFNAEGSLQNIPLAFLSVAREYTWSVAPLFLWMGYLAAHGGFAKEVYSVCRKWLGRLPGGLASASTGACAVLAAVTGSTLTGVFTMGVLGLPEMRKYGYDMKLATASIAVAATIGSLIPPSITFIVYGLLTEVSIGQLLMAGVFPGILFAGMMVTMITIRTKLNPKLGPPGPATTWKVKFTSLREIWAVALVVLMSLGGLYMGVFTPTEAGAMGCFGIIVVSLARRRMSGKSFVTSVIEAIRMNGLIMFIFVAATAFSRFLAGTKLPIELAEWISGFDLAPYAILAIILFVYMILGCVMNALPAVILTLPLFYPMAIQAGFHPVLFGVLIVVMADLGTVTPPIGMNVFAMAAVAKDVPMYDIFKGVLPFWGLNILLVGVLVAFPQISLWLPSTMFG